MALTPPPVSQSLDRQTSFPALTRCGVPWRPLSFPISRRLIANTLRVNGFGGNSDDNDKINVRTWLFRFDHTFNHKFSISNTYYENIRPRIAHCGGPQGCKTVNNGETTSAQTTPTLARDSISGLPTISTTCR